jgi:hypothetical protein
VDFLPPHLWSLFDEKLREAFRGTKVRFDVEVQLDGAEPRVLDVTKVPLKVDGVARGVHMVARHYGRHGFPEHHSAAGPQAQQHIREHHRRLLPAGPRPWRTRQG